MFRLNRHKSGRSGERVECKLSNFQAFQVPRGWDKLFLSVVSVETGKTIAKSSKAQVHGGTCQWTETFSESVWVYQDDVSKELEECLYKISVAMGSARSGILGELIVNLTEYMSPRDSAPLSLPLKKCNYGTILQIKIQCHPKKRSRDRNSWKETTFHHEELRSFDEDKDNKSDGSDNILAKSLTSTSSTQLGITSYADELGNREASLSATASHRSSDSGEGSVGRSSFSPLKSQNGGVYMGRQESSGSHISATSGAGPGDDASRSNQSSFNSRVSDSSYQTSHWQDNASQISAHGTAPLSLRPSDSSLLEAAEETIDELRDEAKMWERHSQKLKHDLEMLKKDNSDKSKHQANVEMELSAACMERDSLKQEVVQLESSLKELMSKQSVTNTTKIDEMIRVRHVLEDELRFQKESNANLNLQMKKTQEANIELVSILQELEETVERQNVEIANLSQNCQIDEPEEDPRSRALLDIETEWESKLSSKEEEIIKLEEKLSDILNAQRRRELVCDEGDPEMTKEIEVLKSKVQELERDCTELTEENLELIFKMKETRNDNREGKNSHHSTFESNNNISPDNSEFKIGLLKPGLEQDLTKKEMLNEDLTMRLKIQIKALEEKCTDLEVELQHFKLQSSHLDLELQKSRAQMREKILEFAELQQKLETLLDTDTESIDINTGVKYVETEACSTMEMSRILSEMNEQLHLAMDCVRNLFSHDDSDADTDFINDGDYVKSICRDTGTVKEHAEALLNDFLELNTLLRERIAERKKNTDEEMVGRKSEMEDLRSCLLLREKEIEDLEQSNRDLEDSISSIEREKSQLEENLEVLEHINGDLEVLISSVQREKDRLEENLADALRESSVSSKCLDDVQQDLLELTRNMETHVSANKILEAKSLELETSKSELEIHLTELTRNMESQMLTNKILETKSLELETSKSELEIHLTELTRNMESQVLTNKMLETKSLELETSKSELEIHLSELSSNMESQVSTNRMLEKKLLELESSKMELEIHLTELTKNMESLVSTNIMLETKSLELESSKNELELRLSEFKVENAQLSEHLSDLEAQLAYLLSEKESKSLELEKSESLIMDLKNELVKQQTEWESQMSELKQKLQDAHMRLSEEQQETEYQKRSQSKLQDTVESLTEECNSLQKLNTDLRRQKLELFERSTHLEVELNESQKKAIDFGQRVEFLERDLSSLHKDINAKEKSLISQVESIFQDHKEHEGRIGEAHRILHQMESAKASEVENLKREIAHLSLQVSSSHDEQENMKSDAVREVFNLRLDKTKLETSLQEAHTKVKLYETEIHSLRQEHGNKVKGLADLLKTSKQSEDMLMADIQRMQSLMVSVKTSEEKFRTSTNELEVKLKASDYEKQQVLEEISSLNVKLEKIARLQDELSTLERSFDEAEFEKGKLEKLLLSVSEECEELKKERASFIEKISNMQNALHDGEDDRRRRIALEEKVLLLERDLTAREASDAHEAELKNELDSVKRAYSECQRKIQCLEVEKEELLRKAQVLEKELLLKNESRHNETVSFENGIKMHTTSHDMEQSPGLVNDVQHIGADQHGRPEDELKSKILALENELAQALETSNMYKNELAQALETSNMYKVQLTSILSEQQNGEAVPPKEITDNKDPNTDNSARIASLETELKEMQERYLHMSLQYAEVEASREELVMQLKSLQKGKRWFS